MFHNPASKGVAGCRENAVEWRDESLTGRDPDRWLRVLSPEVVGLNSDMLDRQSPSVIIPDGSRFFIGARSPVYPCDVRPVLGNFMPQDPFMFYIAEGQIDKPWLYLEAFRLCVTLGPMIGHEKNFTIFKGRALIRDGGQRYSPFLTLIIPHRLGLPVWFPPVMQDLYRYSDRAELKDLYLPTVPHFCGIWERVVTDKRSYTNVQAAMVIRIELGWAKCLH
ncbi:hypothetical protein FIBSPDRAFT_958627 [Athelia psychrophila]|uniref:Uncharacterized protein n=1 Tax=Athelia psychrophila TaxID=1759441 RepID=A0A166EC49_9AGAM|nr:hypothetical protein FIBSPDRAFT_958627 [Fibularhizoctonia sp. CBS 109695]